MASTTHSMDEPSENRTPGDIGAMIEELRAEMARLSDQVQAYLQDQAAHLRDSASETTAEVEEIIRAYPLASVGVALGTGFILGLMVRGGRSEHVEIPRLSRRDFERLASRMRGAVEARSPRVHFAQSDTGDAAFLERLAGALSGLIQSSRSTAASVGSAGGRAARSVAAAGERAARTIAGHL